MPTLYRSPNIPIDDHEWHVCVVRTKGHTYTQYRWRKPGGMWQHIMRWPGRLPKGLGRFFDPFRWSIKVARGEVAVGTARRAA